MRDRLPLSRSTGLVLAAMILPTTSAVLDVSAQSARTTRRGRVYQGEEGAAAVGPRGAAVKTDEGAAAVTRRGAAVATEEGVSAVRRPYAAPAPAGGGRVVVGEEGAA